MQVKQHRTIRQVRPQASLTVSSIVSRFCGSVSHFPCFYAVPLISVYKSLVRFCGLSLDFPFFYGILFSTRKECAILKKAAVSGLWIYKGAKHMKKLRWGVIGAGGIADRRTIPGMMLAKNAELIAVMDINAEQVEKIRQKYGAKRGYTKEEDLLADPEVDAVYIATPIVLHAKQAKLAADYGKDILIEKPLAMTSDEGQEVIDYCERKGVKIAAGFMMRFGSHVMSMKKAIAEGKIGTVVSGYSQFTLWLPYEPGNWRQCKAKAGGGAMMDLSVHTIDLMEYITGMRVTEVASMNEKIAFPEPQYDVEDTSTILMRMENGAQCVVQSNFNIPDEASKWRVEFFGTKGRLLGDTMIGQIDGGKLNAVFIDKNVAYSAEQTHADDVGVEIPGDFGNMYTREIESFSDSILNNKPLVVPASDAVHVQRIMEKAYASGEELKIMKI